MPTRHTVADAPLDCMFLAFEGLHPRTRLWIRPLSQSLGDWLVFRCHDTFGQFGTVLQADIYAVAALGAGVVVVIGYDLHLSKRYLGV
jgi:hypothetical protein